ncbi:hypothetical protein ACFLS1_04050 [Verrucomicrobiota bacterium]
MLEFLHIAKAEDAFQFFFWVVAVIVWVVVQIVRASKKGSSSKTSQQTRSSDIYTAPAQELQKFLESISGTPATPSPAPPPPPPSRSTAFVRRAKPIKPPPLKKKQPAKTKPTVLSAPKPKVAEERTATSTTSRKYRFYHVIADLGATKSLRKAVMLREILESPLALR